MNNEKLNYIDPEFCIQDRKILLLVNNTPSNSSPKLSNNTNKIVNVNNIEIDINQLNSKNEVLIDDLPDSRDNNKTERLLKKQQKKQSRSTYKRPCK
ncbi:32464_t:CDS:2, partial [Gigaspora margarita]